MAYVANSPEPKKINGGALSFPANDDVSGSSSPKEFPQKLRHRLLVPPKTCPSAEDIDNKLKEVDLRRQRFYELLSSKARPKVRRPSNIGLERENLDRRLQAKLSAAEEKRINVLGMCLANQGELRQATKHGAELQFKKQCEQLGTKVKSRAQQAEANKILLLKASTQRRAAKIERAAESLRQKLARERKYKECVYEKKRAHDRLLKVRQIERKRMKDLLEDQLEKIRYWLKLFFILGYYLLAKKQRAEYLRQRRNLNTHQSSKWFVKLRKTTFSLAKVCLSLGIDEKIVKTIPFEYLAHRMELTTTIQTVKAVIGSMCNKANIDHLLWHVTFPTHRDSLSKASGGGVKSIKPGNREAQMPVKLSRYPVRVLLCAYMIIEQPDIVFSGQSDCETTLAESATNFIREFELLIKIIINGPIRCAKVGESFAGLDCRTFRSQLEAFDRAWCSYLHHFVDWKSEDAKLLERDLVRAACQLELSTTGSGNASKDKVKVLFFAFGMSCVTDTGLSLNLMFSENELLVSEIIRKHQSRFADGLDVAHEDHNNLKARVREMMEKAFWDGVLESMNNDEPDFSWVLKLMKEVRDELYEMSPQPWRKEISETIDVYILEEVLVLETSYRVFLTEIYSKYIYFSLLVFWDSNIVLHNKILRELGEVSLPRDESKVPYVLSIIKGLRFILQEIQVARIKLLEPVIRGPAGLEYLKMVLPIQWLSSVSPDVEQEWHEHMDYLCDFTKDNDSSENLFPSTLWTRGTTYLVPEIRSLASNAVHGQPECPKEPMGLLVRLGLLKLVNRVEDLTLEDLPETLKLNVFRLRTVQLQIQKIIVISISMLVFRQSLMVKNLVTNSADVEYIVSQCFEKSMANILAKSLQARDAVYTHVSHSIYLALRGGVFGGTGLNERRLAAEVLIAIASVSFNLHQEWYKVILENL
ncbi:hypothetical protein K2173_009263 [Erythroxylum novogranatense]|uniref:T-complex protein 11 n=1 Tax=Erythroxylum novogranatense TaxID=1862640 RepID=A0AAV8SZN9_9ROSI|nr:hypothetical protein K2173_009263 [Erythroxylum novogranatense]